MLLCRRLRPWVLILCVLNGAEHLASCTHAPAADGLLGRNSCRPAGPVAANPPPIHPPTPRKNPVVPSAGTHTHARFLLFIIIITVVIIITTHNIP